MVVAPAAHADEAPGCVIVAKRPVLDGPVIIGVGVRRGCVQRRIEITVRLREDRVPQPDRTYWEETVTDAINTTITAGTTARTSRANLRECSPR
jgi:hypothetical protein